jgi:multiple sugar transport system permease protein
VRLRHVVLGIRFLVLAAFAGFFFVPVVWLVLAPTKSSGALVTSPPLAFGSLSQVAANWHVLMAFDGGIFATWMGYSFLYVFSATAIVVATAVPAGYALAQSRFPGRKLVLTLTLVMMIMPSAALTIPIFLELNAVNLIGNPLSMILAFSFYPFGVYLAYLYFATAVPRELLDAARVDGAGELRMFLRVALPLSRPIVAIIFFFNFVADWSNFFLPFVVLPNSSTFSIQPGLQLLLSSVPRPSLALAILISILPVLAVFLFAQRFLVRGLLQGASTG